MRLIRTLRVTIAKLAAFNMIRMKIADDSEALHQRGRYRLLTSAAAHSIVIKNPPD
jgi:hypothetical protein